MANFFSSLKTERLSRRIYRARDDAKADVFDYIERFYNPKRRHSTIGYLSPIAFEEEMELAQPTVHKTGDRPDCLVDRPGQNWALDSGHSAALQKVT